MKSKLAIRGLYSPRHPDTRGKCCLKLTDLFHCPPLLFTMMMQSHVTQFWPPDWLWLHTSGIPRCLRGQLSQLVSHDVANGGANSVSTYFSFLSCHKGIMPFSYYASWPIRVLRAH